MNSKRLFHEENTSCQMNTAKMMRIARWEKFFPNALSSCLGERSAERCTYQVSASCAWLVESIPIAHSWEHCLPLGKLLHIRVVTIVRNWRWRICEIQSMKLVLGRLQHFQQAKWFISFARSGAKNNHAINLAVSHPEPSALSNVPVHKIHAWQPNVSWENGPTRKNGTFLHVLTVEFQKWCLRFVFQLLVYFFIFYSIA